MPLHSCALTNKGSARGVRKESGECLLTKAALLEPAARGQLGVAAEDIKYTKCAVCNTSVCNACWELVAAVATEHGVRIVFNGVWAAFLALHTSGERISHSE